MKEGSSVSYVFSLFARSSVLNDILMDASNNSYGAAQKEEVGEVPSVTQPHNRS